MGRGAGQLQATTVVEVEGQNYQPRWWRGVVAGHFNMGWGSCRPVVSLLSGVMLAYMGTTSILINTSLFLSF